MNHQVKVLSVPDRSSWQLDIIDFTQASLERAFLPTMLNRLQNLIEEYRKKPFEGCTEDFMAKIV